MPAVVGGGVCESPQVGPFRVGDHGCMVSQGLLRVGAGLGIVRAYPEGCGVGIFSSGRLLEGYVLRVLGLAFRGGDP